MKKISEIRLQNALQLANNLGSKAEFARLLEMSDSYMWQILGDKQMRNIGNSIARRMEKACGKPDGWLDTEHSEIAGEKNNLAQGAREEVDLDLAADAQKVALAFSNLSTVAQKKAVIAQLKAFGVWK